MLYTFYKFDIQTTLRYCKFTTNCLYCY